MAPLVVSPSPSKTEALEMLGSISSPDEQLIADKKVVYGTAGFREIVSMAPMTRIMTRTAAFATLRSLSYLGSPVGVMITASHNDESYNGVKIADPNGGMMPEHCEEDIVWMVNHESVDKLWEWITEQQTKAQTQSATESSTANAIIPVIYLGRDTRSHSKGFRDVMVKAAVALGARVVDLGVVTTPMLHHAVLHANSSMFLPKTLIPPRPNVEGYLELLAYSYTALCQTGRSVSTPCKPSSTLLVDCACGVGFPALVELYHRIRSIDSNSRDIRITNGPDMGMLNHECGSEFVQKQIREPVWYEQTMADSSDTMKEYCAAFDGDADRIVFFSPESSRGSNFFLLDGDQISCLVCEFIQAELQVLRNNIVHFPELKLGVVQTAYANGASTRYLQKTVGEDSVCIAKTGVKHLHAAAHGQFDIGIYFEANGHGTVLFGPNFYKAIDIAQREIIFADKQCDKLAYTALQRLSLLPSLVNQAVGDALSDLLLVDAILYIKGWNLADWHSNQYQDYPSRQMKVLVVDRTIIKTNHNETQCLAPPGVQEELDNAMQRIKDACVGPDPVARTFIRPSGTEDVVRIYAEASTRDEADQLAAAAESVVRNLCNGKD